MNGKIGKVGREGGDDLKEIVNAAEAARILNVAESYVRFYASEWDFAKVRHIKGRKNKRYDISTRKMCSEFDIPLEEAERRLTQVVAK